MHVVRHRQRPAAPTARMLCRAGRTASRRMFARGRSRRRSRRSARSRFGLDARGRRSRTRRYFEHIPWCAWSLLRRSLVSSHREERVSFDVQVDLRSGPARRRCWERRVTRSRAADHVTRSSSEELQRLVDEPSSARPPSRSPVRVPRDDDVPSLGSGRNRSGSESQVRRPITTGWPMVAELGSAAMSSRSRHQPPSRPIDAAPRECATSETVAHGDRRADRRMVLVADDLEVLDS